MYRATSVSNKYAIKTTIWLIKKMWFNSTYTSLPLLHRHFGSTKHSGPNWNRTRIMVSKLVAGRRHKQSLKQVLKKDETKGCHIAQSKHSILQIKGHTWREKSSSLLHSLHRHLWIVEANTLATRATDTIARGYIVHRGKPALNDRDQGTEGKRRQTTELQSWLAITDQHLTE
jgi:hypothetical protein